MKHKLIITIDEEDTVWMERENEDTSLEDMRDMLFGAYQAVMNALQENPIKG